MYFSVFCIKSQISLLPPATQKHSFSPRALELAPVVCVANVLHWVEAGLSKCVSSFRCWVISRMVLGLNCVPLPPRRDSLEKIDSESKELGAILLGHLRFYAVTKWTWLWHWPSGLPKQKKEISHTILSVHTHAHTHLHGMGKRVRVNEGGT